MNTKFDLYPFLISRNKNQDYRLIVAPDFLFDNRLSALIQAARSESETEPGIVLHCRVNFAADTEKNFTLIFRVDTATAKDIGKNSREILTDSIGRYIKLIEGVVYDGLIPEQDVRITSRYFQKVREYLTQYYRDFWRNQTNKVFSSQAIVHQDISSELLSVRSIPTYNVPQLFTSTVPTVSSEQILKLPKKTIKNVLAFLLISLFISVAYRLLPFFFHIR